MQSSTLARERARTTKAVLVFACVGWTLVAGRAWSASPEPSGVPVAAPPAATAPPAAGQEHPGNFDDWRTLMVLKPAPKTGCFTASYPSTDWREVPCTTAPARPYPPAGGRRSDTVGNATDIVVAANAPPISLATGTFPGFQGPASLTGTLANNECPPSTTVPSGPDVYSLQLNANTFNTPLCAASPNGSDCQGWQQFVLNNPGTTGNGSAFVQYWLLNYQAQCPTPLWSVWPQDSNPPANCWINSPAVTVPAQPAAQLTNLSLTGSFTTATSGVTVEEITVFTAQQPPFKAQVDDVLGLRGGWTAAEFNVFGNSCGVQVQFNPGVTMLVQTSISDKTTNAPPEVTGGFTAETNNLNLIYPVCPIAGATPAILFSQSNAANAPSPCACQNGGTWSPASASCVCSGAGQVMKNGQCACSASDQVLVNGVCKSAINACGGTSPLPALVGHVCGTGNATWQCSGLDTVRCTSFKNACGGASAFAVAAGAGPQPGETCRCSGTATGHYACLGGQMLCDCAQ